MQIFIRNQNRKLIILYDIFQFKISLHLKTSHYKEFVTANGCNEETSCKFSNNSQILDTVSFILVKKYVLLRPGMQNCHLGEKKRK